MALDKSNNDDQLIEVLREEINRLQGKLQSNQRMTQDLQQKVQHHKKTANALMNASLGGSGGGNNTGHFSSYDDSMLATSQSLHQSLHHLHHLPPPSAPNEQEWLQKEQQYQAEINRLQRLCRNQVRWIYVESYVIHFFVRKGGAIRFTGYYYQRSKKTYETNAILTINWA